MLFSSYSLQRCKYDYVKKRAVNDQRAGLVLFSTFDTKVFTHVVFSD